MVISEKQITKLLAIAQMHAVLCFENKLIEDATLTLEFLREIQDQQSAELKEIQ